MRILVDSNVLISAAFFGGKPRTAMELALAAGDVLLIPEAVIAECRRNAAEAKLVRHGGLSIFEDFLSTIPFESVPAVEPGQEDVALRIRHDKDLPILWAAVLGRADAIVTGDGDFHAGDTSTGGVPVMRPGEFVERFG